MGVSVWEGEMDKVWPVRAGNDRLRISEIIWRKRLEGLSEGVEL